MGGFFGITSKKDCLLDVFFGTDYHSHLGTKRGGLAAYDPEIGLQRRIHSIENAPFRTKFEGIFSENSGRRWAKTFFGNAGDERHRMHLGYRSAADADEVSSRDLRHLYGRDH